MNEKQKKVITYLQSLKGFKTEVKEYIENNIIMIRMDYLKAEEEEYYYVYINDRGEMTMEGTSFYTLIKLMR